MENNTSVNKKEIEKIIKALSLAKKPSLTILYFSILFSGLLSMLVEINMYNNSVFDSSVKFCLSFFAISIFFIFLHSYVNKVSIMSGLYVVNQLIDCMSRNDWNHPFPRRLHALILIHPVFRVIAGLYLCKAGNKDDGVAMINKAVSESPETNDYVSLGKTTNAINFKALSNIIARDLLPSKTYITAFRVFMALNWLLILIIVIALISAALYDFFILA